MRSAYRERLEAITDAAGRYCGGALHIRPVRTGLHAVADVHGVDADRVWNEAAARDVEVMPLAAYSAGRTKIANALVIGFAAVDPEKAVAGMQRLAAAIEAARDYAAASGCRDQPSRGGTASGAAFAGAEPFGRDGPPSPRLTISAAGRPTPTMWIPIELIKAIHWGRPPPLAADIGITT